MLVVVRPPRTSEDTAACLAQLAAEKRASIAAFARASLDLIALGAPADLLRDTHLAALDEAAHVRKCHDLASRLVGVTLEASSVSMLPIRSPSFALVAVSMVRACIDTAVSAVAWRERVAMENNAEVATFLAAIASDEQRHVELAFRTLAWLVDAGGQDASRAVREAVAGLIPDHPIVRDVVLPRTQALLET
jgi:hypothetical protein